VIIAAVALDQFQQNLNRRRRTPASPSNKNSGPKNPERVSAVGGPVA
jgi:hypothetical protein